MISPTGSVVIREVLRELKLSNEEDQKINREAANANFDAKIAELRGQVDLLKKQADKVGSMGIFSFVMSFVTAVLAAVSAAIGAGLINLSTMAAKTAVRALSAAQGFLGGLNTLISGFAEKDKINQDAQIKEKQIQADTFEKFFQDYNAQEQEAKQRVREVLQTMKEVQRDTTEAHEAMVKI